MWLIPKALNRFLWICLSLDPQQLRKKVLRYHTVTPFMSSGTSDADLFDSYDNRADEEEAGSAEEHKSVMCCLSQVRLGMDLTNIVLPTFIL